MVLNCYSRDDVIHFPSSCAVQFTSITAHKNYGRSITISTLVSYDLPIMDLVVLGFFISFQFAISI